MVVEHLHDHIFNACRYLEAKKKKNKKSEEWQDFPGCEQIQFGDVVQAPPKFTAPSKVWLHCFFIFIYELVDILLFKQEVL